MARYSDETEPVICLGRSTRPVREEALLALQGPAPRSGIFWSRDHPEDEELWLAALECLARPQADDVWGAFPYWFGRTVHTPERASMALGRLFANLDRPGQQASYLLGLEDLPSPGVLAGLGAEMTEIARLWRAQRPVAEPYGSSHNAVLAWAQVFLPRIREVDRPPLADACFACLPAHDRPPALGAFQALGWSLERHLSPASLAPALQLLDRGLAGIAGLDLQPYRRKRKPVNPSNVPDLQLGFHGLRAIRAHPEWDVALPGSASLLALQDLLSRC